MKEAEYVGRLKLFGELVVAKQIYLRVHRLVAPDYEIWTPFKICNAPPNTPSTNLTSYNIPLLNDGIGVDAGAVPSFGRGISMFDSLTELTVHRTSYNGHEYGSFSTKGSPSPTFKPKDYLHARTVELAAKKQGVANQRKRSMKEPPIYVADTLTAIQKEHFPSIRVLRSDPPKRSRQSQQTSQVQPTKSGKKASSLPQNAAAESTEVMLKTTS